MRNKYLYAVYDEEDNGICVAIGNVREVCDFLGMTSTQVVGRVSETMRRVKEGKQAAGRCRYTIMKVEGDL